MGNLSGGKEVRSAAVSHKKILEAVEHAIRWEPETQ